MSLDVKQNLKHRMAISYPSIEFDNIVCRDFDYSMSWHLAKDASMSFLQMVTNLNAINF
mgnify:CR=1 FL=1